ncbi:hypothetical protein VP01_6426g1, partial [Puccinia sorghi]
GPAQHPLDPTAIVGDKISLTVRGFLQSCKLLFFNDPTSLPMVQIISGTPPKSISLLSHQQLGPIQTKIVHLLNSLSMKDNGKVLTYIAQFRTLQSRIDWNDTAFAFHFQKGLPSCITDQLALTRPRLKTLQQLINQIIELDNCYHNKIRCLKDKNKLISKPFTPSASTSAPRLRKPTKIALVLNKEGKINLEERVRREREGLFLYCGGKHELDSCVKYITREAAKVVKK